MINVKFKSGKFLVDEKSYQSLSSKGFGYNTKNLFELDVYEALYLFEKGKIEVFFGKKKLNFNDIIKKKKILLKNYIVYKDLKSKGYNVKSGLKYGFTFRVYDKGIKIGEDHSLWLVEAIEETKKINIKDIVGMNRIAHSTKKKMMFAIVDIENGVTYLENSWKRV
jgi:tRNA-intron endonuclease